jgi:hypothetical protein
MATAVDQGHGKYGDQTANGRFRRRSGDVHAQRAGMAAPPNNPRQYAAGDLTGSEERAAGQPRDERAP